MPDNLLISESDGFPVRQKKVSKQFKSPLEVMRSKTSFPPSFNAPMTPIKRRTPIFSTPKKTKGYNPVTLLDDLLSDIPTPRKPRNSIKQHDEYEEFPPRKSHSSLAVSGSRTLSPEVSKRNHSPEYNIEISLDQWYFVVSQMDEHGDDPSLWLAVVGLSKFGEIHTKQIRKRISPQIVQDVENKLYNLQEQNSIKMRDEGFSDIFALKFRNGFPKNWMSLLKLELSKLNLSGSTNLDTYSNSPYSSVHAHEVHPPDYFQDPIDSSSRHVNIENHRASFNDVVVYSHNLTNVADVIKTKRMDTVIFSSPEQDSMSSSKNPEKDVPRIQNSLKKRRNKRKTMELPKTPSQEYSTDYFSHSEPKSRSENILVAVTRSGRKVIRPVEYWKGRSLKKVFEEFKL